MLLARLVEQVERVRATSRRTEKVELIADLLRQTREKETELVALYLAGHLPQGRIGIGWRAVRSAMAEGRPSGEPPSLLDVDRALGDVARETGPGSTGRRRDALRQLFQRAARGQVSKGQRGQATGSGLLKRRKRRGLPFARPDPGCL